jgi:hypothetical protein
MKSKLKYEIYLIPILLFIAIFNFHYYGFYENDYEFNKSIIQPNFSRNEYDKIMGYHPYSIIYQYAKMYENTNNQIYLLLLKKDDKNLDYTSTYYLNLNNKSGIQTKAYLGEIGTMTNYLFYPKKVTTFYDLSKNELSKIKFEKNNIIVSDTEIHPNYVSTYKLKRIMFDRERNPLVRINRKMEDIYYLYIVDSNAK